MIKLTCHSKIFKQKYSFVERNLRKICVLVSGISKLCVIVSQLNLLLAHDYGNRRIFTHTFIIGQTITSYSIVSLLPSSWSKK